MITIGMLVKVSVSLLLFCVVGQVLSRRVSRLSVLGAIAVVFCFGGGLVFGLNAGFLCHSIILYLPNWWYVRVLP